MAPSRARTKDHMTNSWPPPHSEPTPPAWAPPEAAPLSPTVAAPQSAPSPHNWPPPQAGSWPGYSAPPVTDDRALAWLLPVHRSALAIAAGYVGLFGLVIVVLGPIALLLGILAVRDLRRHPDRLGRGRAWFAIIAGVWGIAVVLFVAANYLVLAT